MGGAKFQCADLQGGGGRFSAGQYRGVWKDFSAPESENSIPIAIPNDSSLTAGHYIPAIQNVML